MLHITDIMRETGVTNESSIYRAIAQGRLPRALRICGRLCWPENVWRLWLEEQARAQGVEFAPSVTIENAEPAPLRRRGRPRKIKSTQGGGQ